MLNNRTYRSQDREWWVKLRNPSDIMKNHDSFLYCEVVILFISFLTFVHGQYCIVYHLQMQVGYESGCFLFETSFWFIYRPVIQL